MSYTNGDEFDNSRISTCCGATMLADIERCSECKEYADSYDANDDERPLTDKEFSEMYQNMASLYQAEVNAGVHVPSTAEERNLRA